MLGENPGGATGRESRSYPGQVQGAGSARELVRAPPGGGGSEKSTVIPVTSPQKTRSCTDFDQWPVRTWAGLSFGSHLTCKAFWSWLLVVLLCCVVGTPQVSSGEAAAATLRLDEMATALETQQRELASLRAIAREKATMARKRRHHHHHYQEQQQQETVGRREEDNKKREKNQRGFSSSSDGCVNNRGSSRVLTERIDDDTSSAAPNATAAASETHEVEVVASSERGSVVPDVDNSNNNNTAGSPDDEETSAAAHPREVHLTGDRAGDPAGHPAGGTVRNKTVNNVVEDTKGDDPVKDIKDNNRKDDPKDNEPPPESHRCCDDDAGKCPRPCPNDNTQKTRTRLLRSEDSDDRGQQSPSTATETHPLGAEEAPPLKGGTETVSSAEGGANFEGQNKNERRQDKEGGGGWGTRATVGVDAEVEAELLVKMRLGEEEEEERKSGWEKEAVCLRVERQELLRRLRTLAREAHEKVSPPSTSFCLL